MRVIPMGSYDSGFEISGDGQRFLMIKEVAGGSSAVRDLVVVQHFDEELKRLVPTN